MQSFFNDIWNRSVFFMMVLSIAYVGLKYENYEKYFKFASPVQASAPRAPQSVIPDAAPAAAPAAQPEPIKASEPAIKVSGAGFTRSLQPKIKGEWTVDCNSGPGSDTAVLQEAIRSAKDGDVIKLRPCVYKGALKVTKDVSLVGEDRKTVIIESDEKDVVQVDGKKLQLKHMTVRNVGNHDYGTVIMADGADLYMESVTVEVPPSVAKIGGIAIDRMRSARFSDIALKGGFWAFLIRDSRLTPVEIRNSSLKDSESIGIFIEDSDLRMENVEFSKIRGRALRATDTKMNLSGITITESKDGFYINRCSDVSIRNLTASDVGSGVIIVENTNLNLNNAKVSGISRTAFVVSDNSVVQINGLQCTKCDSGLSVTNAKLDLQNSVFKNISSQAVSLTKSEVKLLNVSIDDASSAITLRDSSKLNLNHVAINNVKSGVYVRTEAFREQLVEISASYLVFTATGRPWNADRFQMKFSGSNNSHEP